MAESRNHVGLIIARSSEVPAPADDLFYTVQVEDIDGVIVYPNIVPQAYDRMSYADVDLVPFPIGHRVPIGVSRLGSHEQVDILAGEKSDAGECVRNG